MSTNKKLLSATLAAAAAMTFASAPITSALAAGTSGDVQCYGVNSCKGQSNCKTASSSCKGTNSCKGQGYLMKTAKQCKKLGGSLEEPTS